MHRLFLCEIFLQTVFNLQISRKASSQETFSTLSNQTAMSWRKQVAFNEITTMSELPVLMAVFQNRAKKYCCFHGRTE